MSVLAQLEQLTSTQELPTPFEIYNNKQTTNQLQPFSQYDTQSVELRVSPELLDQLKELKGFKVSQEFSKLSEFVTALQAKLDISYSKPNQSISQNISQNIRQSTKLLNPLAIATAILSCETPADISEATLAKAAWDLSSDSVYTYVGNSGSLVWERLEGERVDFYNLFKVYRDSRYGALANGDYLLCSRSLAGLAKKLNLSPRLLYTIGNIYNWSLRCQCYDQFFDVEIARRKVLHQQLLQADHATKANHLVEMSMAWLENNSRAIKAKDAIAMLELGLRFSRLSVGLPTDKLTEQVVKPSTQVNINNQDNSQQQSLSIHAHMTPVEQQVQQDMKDEGHLLSILHVLQQSGAMSSALTKTKAFENAIEADVVDA